ncbi:MAG: transglycosylase SLT domain-containing protein, partial [Proteobacteria bacterium]|nr:transglycosylase SLT domain-containing protein [Pseudomonadota bacterium]
AGLAALSLTGMIKATDPELPRTAPDPAANLIMPGKESQQPLETAVSPVQKLPSAAAEENRGKETGAGPVTKMEKTENNHEPKFDFRLSSQPSESEEKPAWTKDQIIAEMRRQTHRNRIPFNLLYNLNVSESSLRPEAKSESDARGIAQFVPSTQLEYMYKCADRLSHPYSQIAKENIEAVRRKGKLEYRVKPGRDEQRVLDAAYNPSVSITMQIEYLRYLITYAQENLPVLLQERIDRLEASGKKDKTTIARIAEIKKHLQRPITYADVKALYQLGQRGGLEELVSNADPLTRKDKAYKHAMASFNTIAKNAGTFYFDGKNMGSPRTVGQLMEHYRHLMGNHILPASLQQHNHG